MKTELYPRFEHAEFGDMFKTQDGTRAIYIERVDDFDERSEPTHIFYLAGVGCKRYYDDGRSVDGIASDDIIGRDNDVDEDKEYFVQGWQLTRINDCLKQCRRYISAVERRNNRDDKRIKELLDMITKTRELVKL